MILESIMHLSLEEKSHLLGRVNRFTIGIDTQEVSYFIEHSRRPQDRDLDVWNIRKIEDAFYDAKSDQWVNFAHCSDPIEFLRSINYSLNDALSVTDSPQFQKYLK